MRSEWRRLSAMAMPTASTRLSGKSFSASSCSDYTLPPLSLVWGRRQSTFLLDRDCIGCKRLTSSWTAGKWWLNKGNRRKIPYMPFCIYCRWYIIIHNRTTKRRPAPQGDSPTHGRRKMPCRASANAPWGKGQRPTGERLTPYRGIENKQWRVNLYEQRIERILQI